MSSAAETFEVRNEVEAGRFEVEVDGLTAFTTYRIEGEDIIFPHTVTPEALEGRGIASALVRAGLAFAEAEGLRVVPRCSFWAGYITRHPEYLPLVHPDYRERLRP
jgi:predicted GNAT family acetyltransferase